LPDQEYTKEAAKTQDLPRDRGGEPGAEADDRIKRLRLGMLFASPERRSEILREIRILQQSQTRNVVDWASRPAPWNRIGLTFREEVAAIVAEARR
jgi:hypothetical protein